MKITDNKNKEKIGVCCFVLAILCCFSIFVFSFNGILFCLFFVLLALSNYFLHNSSFRTKTNNKKDFYHPFNQSNTRPITDPLNPSSPNNPANYHYTRH